MNRLSDVVYGNAARVIKLRAPKIVLRIEVVGVLPARPAKKKKLQVALPARVRLQVQAWLEGNTDTPLFCYPDYVVPVGCWLNVGNFEPVNTLTVPEGAMSVEGKS